MPYEKWLQLAGRYMRLFYEVDIVDVTFAPFAYTQGQTPIQFMDEQARMMGIESKYDVSGPAAVRPAGQSCDLR